MSDDCLPEGTIGSIQVICSRHPFELLCDRMNNGLLQIVPSRHDHIFYRAVNHVCDALGLLFSKTMKFNRPVGGHLKSGVQGSVKLSD